MENLTQEQFGQIMRVLGRLEACSKATQDETIRLRENMHDKHKEVDSRLDKLEAFRNRAIGYALAVTTPVAAGAGWVTNLLAAGDNLTS